ncbi:DUF4433 domain-containing protein [Bosea sp. LjRoot90]|uniref:DarT ssDNA thymidine ADP-ribosyltransferase family protein n=1 Tax=Bosea sp. LjRoot90 TaxID=3342342 RepID=UPI003ED09064
MTLDELIRLIDNSAQHKHLYHFTDESNLPGILQLGILSKQQLRARGLWPPPAPGGNELSRNLDLQRGIDPYVSLCMTRNHGMRYRAGQEGRQNNSFYLGISSEVLRIPGARIAFGVANANGVVNLPVAEALDQLDAEVIYTRMEWKNPEINARLRAAEKFEVLVPNSVPRNLVVERYRG